MKKRFIVPLGVLAIVAVCTIIGLGATNAPPSDDSAGIEPTTQAEGVGWYSTAQIDAKWAEVTADYEEELPSGTSFPVTAPEFFHPQDGQDHLWEEGLTETIAARYWRCAWIDEALEQEEAGRDAAANEALDAIDSYAGLPGVAGVVDVDVYDSTMRDAAEREGTDAHQEEFTLDCGREVYLPQEAQK